MRNADAQKTQAASQTRRSKIGTKSSSESPSHTSDEPFHKQRYVFRPAGATFSDRCLQNGSVFVSLVCFRDAQPWQILSGVSSQEILSKSKELKAEGWSPTEVAGYHDKSDKYIGVWKKGAPSLVYIDVGLSKTQHDANFQKLMNLNLYMHQQHVFFDANNQYRFSNIWYRKPSSTTKWGSWYGGVDNHKSKQGIHPFQSDTTVATQGSSLVYSGSWVDHPLYISLELIDLDLVEHQSKANQLMNLGYRPFAVDACFAKNEIQSSSVWYRPK
ncbi:MAG: hypothetical protein K0U86_13105 [Planctomycetes bacterium]|nr:hypothetical protein [Planctomycetota bacterium]MCH9775392.1 hypothetical protein [Planctomycetota bacterium]